MRKLRFLMPILVFLSIMLLNLLSCEKNPSESKLNVPEVTTADVIEITQNTSQCGGTITSDGGETVTARGVCWSTSQTPTIADNKTNDGTGVGSFTSNITGLTAETTYYVCAYATNSAGTGYGIAMSFTTETTVTLTDIDGNVYQTVQIGTQLWMSENLKVTHYRNGDAIPNVTDGTEWSNLTTGAYCNYGNNVNNAATYGSLYNWYSVNDSRNIAPEGWHVPTDSEWQTLIDYLGGSSVAGGKLKGWGSPATNESGFSALGAGYRFNTGSYDLMFNGTGFFSSSESASDGAWGWTLGAESIIVQRSDQWKESGLSVRCVRD